MVIDWLQKQWIESEQGLIDSSSVGIVIKTSNNLTISRNTFGFSGPKT